MPPSLALRISSRRYYFWNQRVTSQRHVMATPLQIFFIQYQFLNKILNLIPGPIIPPLLPVRPAFPLILSYQSIRWPFRLGAETVAILPAWGMNELIAAIRRKSGVGRLLDVNVEVILSAFPPQFNPILIPLLSMTMDDLHDLWSNGLVTTLQCIRT